MIVTDASVVVAYLCGEATAAERAGVLTRAHAPALLDVEVTQALRGLVRGEKLDLDRAQEARTDLADLAITRCADASLLPRAWELRERYTIYDALYLALAEALGGTLYTRDVRLARGAAGTARCEVLVTG